jgi:putative spermidine/putrescine transport system ATP-binding protein
MSFLVLQNLEKRFGANKVVHDFSLSIDQGEFVSLLGPSGCGKTTVLRMVAGFETPSGGSIRLAGDDVTRTHTRQRNIGMVFQSYALFPNLTVADNIGFGLKVGGATRKSIEERVSIMLKLIGLTGLEQRYPYQLSGGQQQRVALARALARQPQVLLLDEPLSALDAKIRASLRSEIRNIQRALGITTIFVTHDQEEALSLSDRVVVMNAGLIEQVGQPHEIYNRPASQFVAQFVGTLNTVTARVLDPGTGRIEIGGHPMALGAPLSSATAGSELALAIRPESVHLGRAPDADMILPATIEDVDFLGSVIRLKASAAGAKWTLDSFNRPGEPPPPIGTHSELSFYGRDFIVLAA